MNGNIEKQKGVTLKPMAEIMDKLNVLKERNNDINHRLRESNDRLSGMKPSDGNDKM